MKSFSQYKRIRNSFGKIEVAAEIPNLIEVQKNSYDGQFLQLNIPTKERKNIGLQAVLTSVFPINDASGQSTLEFIKYELEEPKYDVEECVQRGMSFAAPIKLTLRLILWEVDKDTGARDIKGIKEQEVYLGDIPLMTKNGTFIFNGIERVVVSQMHRSPGVFFDHDDGKTMSSGKYLYTARIIPYRGSWLDFEFDAKDILYFRIDRKRKMYASTLLYAIGMTTDEIYSTYYQSYRATFTKDYVAVDYKFERFSNQRFDYDIIDDSTGKVVFQEDTKITPRLAKKAVNDGIKKVRIRHEELIGSFLKSEVLNAHTGEVILEAGFELTTDAINTILDHKVSSIEILEIDNNTGPYLRNTMALDKNKDKESALVEIYKVLRPGEPSTIEAADIVFRSLFFDFDRYDLSEVGRVKTNSRLGIEVPENHTVLTEEDIKLVIKTLLDLRDSKGSVDDIDNLSNRRVRSVGELLENQFRLGLIRMEKTIIERMNVVEIDSVMPHDLINSKLLMSVIKEFFGLSQLSQFMDQTNPLSEITHKRRLSALGPGGLSRERAGFEVRDVHATHYGRICPIETPEGQNIGLINSLSTYARINKHGFIESPYRRVENGVVTEEVVYLSAIQESKYKIGPANVTIDENNKVLDELVNCRMNGNFVLTKPEEMDFVDVTPMQVVSVAASMIPFLENDDANRALMGSNMQRQAVPLLTSDAPFVGTGIEKVVAKDSGASIVALHDGIVERVDSSRIVVRTLETHEDGSPGVDIYRLSKFQRSNHNTCINQKPLVNTGDFVKKGDVIADGPSTDTGEIALGKNVLVAFVPWSGYNFEDSIVISERIVKDDVFTSIHIEEFEIVARDTRLGPEEITRDIPNSTDESLRHLDEVGIINIGAEVRPGDTLVGKVTPKSQAPMTPEEKLLRAIFGEKAADVRDSSLHVPPGIYGTVVEVRVFSRRGVEKDQRAKEIERMQIDKLSKDRDDEIAIIDYFAFATVRSLLKDQIIISGPKGVKPKDQITEDMLSSFTKNNLWQFVIEDEKVMSEIEQIHKSYEEHRDAVFKRYQNKVDKLQTGDDLPQGALKVVKVFVATKHKLQPGDKMAGRHGNKGVVSRIVPVEDMPFLENGQPVDIVLNPLGLPSRMNTGQILETHLGWAAGNLGKQIGKMINDHSNNNLDLNEIRAFVGKIYKNKKLRDDLLSLNDQEFLEVCSNLKHGIHYATPVFDGAKVEDIKDMLRLAGLDESGQVRLIDGRTGEYFDREVTVGYKYLLKLHHLVDDKIHARSIGPYSLVTQQPLGGKSHFGGQRFGEMECWALQAYGASYTLQEMLTIKSDDVAGRIKIYESIVKCDNNFEYGIPESFNVMIKELRSLCLNIELEESEENEDDETTV